MVVSLPPFAVVSGSMIDDHRAEQGVRTLIEFSRLPTFAAELPAQLRLMNPSSDINASVLNTGPARSRFRLERAKRVACW